MLHRKRNRLAGFDYSSKRQYFVTICVKDRIESFGTIENKSIRLSPNGIISQEQWYWLGNQFPYVESISFIIMPDHIHGIIFINADYYNYNGNGRDHSQRKIKPLPEIIGAYKTTVSKRIHMAGDMGFKWQKSYHDHIIRDFRSLNKIKNYIEKNPENWNGNTILDM